MKHENPQLTFMTFLELATKYHKCIQNKYEIKKHQRQMQMIR